MSRLPVIVGIGGINPAGRSSGHHGYRRLVIDNLGTEMADDTWQSLAGLMQLSGPLTAEQKGFIRQHTLVRKLENNLFEPNAILVHKNARLNPSASEPMTFALKRNQLPDSIPPGWQVTSLDNVNVLVTADQHLDILFPDSRASRVNSGGQLPTGFNPETLYQSRKIGRAHV